MKDRAPIPMKSRYHCDIYSHQCLKCRLVRTTRGQDLAHSSPRADIHLKGSALSILGRRYFLLIIGNGFMFEIMLVKRDKVDYGVALYYVIFMPLRLSCPPRSFMRCLPRLLMALPGCIMALAHQSRIASSLERNRNFLISCNISFFLCTFLIEGGREEKRTITKWRKKKKIAVNCYLYLYQAPSRAKLFCGGAAAVHIESIEPELALAEET